MDTNKLNIYVLTTQNEERVNFMKKSLHDLEFNFVNSDTKENLLELEKKYKKISHKFRIKSMMFGEIGAFKTHAKAWQEIVDSNKPGIIIEDSADFVRDPSFLNSDECYELVQSCGLISFSDYQFKLSPDKPTFFLDIPLKKAFPIRCYGITPFRAEILLDSMKKTAYVMPVDKWLSIPKLSGVFGFVSHIGIAIRKRELSSIANQRKGQRTLNPINLCSRIKNKIKYKY